MSELPTRNPELNTTGKLTHPARQPAIRNPRAAFTLIEVLVAMAVTLILMGIVVTIFGVLGDNVSDTRGLMEMSEQVRGCKQRLQSDLAGITVTTLPPRRPELDQGYLEIIEGPVGRIEGTSPNAAIRQAVTVPVPDENDVSGNDTSVGDNDDILMFTTRSSGEPFVGRFGTTTMQSPVAEIAWFLRGTTLYRRVLLVKPSVTPQQLTAAAGSQLYANCDVSVRAAGGIFDLAPNAGALRLVANSLGDLSKRECRFAHKPLCTNWGSPRYGWPHDVRIWGSASSEYGRLGLPTLQECSHPDWTLPLALGSLTPWSTSNCLNLRPNTQFDAWKEPNPWAEVDPATGILLDFPATAANNARVGEDVILTHVLQFDVKVWDPRAPVFTLDASGAIVAPGNASGTMVLMPGDPGYPEKLEAWVGMGSPPPENLVTRGAYVDLNYAYTDKSSANYHNISWFSGPGDPRSGLAATAGYPAAVYDTWSTHYEHDGIDQDGDGQVDEGTDGFDSEGDAVVDNPGEPFTDSNEDGGYDSGETYTDVNNDGGYDAGEQEAPPPYAAPLRGIQIRIRAFEPDSRQIREVTIVQEFLPE